MAASTTNRARAASHRGDVDELVSLAFDILPSTRRSSGLYCFDRAFGSAELRGESVRYSLMVLLGLQRAEAAGYQIDTSTGDLLDLCVSHGSDVTPGDIGLALWADARAEGAATAKLLRHLSRAAPDEASLSHLAGMEIAWLVIGLAHAVERTPSASGPLAIALDHLQHRRRAPSGFYYHDASSRVRRRLPNFATEIYTLLALALLGQRGVDADARRDAERLAGHLLRLQLPDGGWPWLFDADRAAVVERYEIYSVHQDAMAPMALLEVAQLTGDPKYAAAAIRGLSWSRGANELGVTMLDRNHRFAHRSIRRRRPWARASLTASSMAALSIGRPLRLAARTVELNATCRPYHLGWILEAWAGRESVVVGDG